MIMTKSKPRSAQIRLNLGCYDKHLPGFINVDVRPECNPDVVDDVIELHSFDDGTVDLIYASHMLEHVRREDVHHVLRNWYNKLKTGGILRLAVPDFDAIARRYIYTGEIEEIMSPTMGSQRHDYDFHYVLFDEKSLSNALKEAGFDEVFKWDWATTNPHRYVDDFSSSYLPARSRPIPLSGNRIDVTYDFDGIHMSLNLEAVK
jgi:predicted SAM-dependent methyltransferase